MLRGIDPENVQEWLYLQSKTEIAEYQNRNYQMKAKGYSQEDEVITLMTFVICGAMQSDIVQIEGSQFPRVSTTCASRCHPVYVAFGFLHLAPAMNSKPY